LIARKIEELGIPTIYLGSCRDIMEQIKPPRSAFLNFPLGRPCGKPHDANLQRNILKDALHLLNRVTDPGKIVDLPYEWGTPFDWKKNIKDIMEMLKAEGKI